MYNPSYLIKSRHDIYYFRYPLPIKSSRQNNRICISLGTRCPREALRLAKYLEYHTAILMTRMDTSHMDHVEVMNILKAYHADALERAKGKIDKEGPYSKERIGNLKDIMSDWEYAIQEDASHIVEAMGCTLEEVSSTHHALWSIC